MKTNTPVTAIMTREFLQVTEAATVDLIFDIMALDGPSGLPVVGPNNELIGMVDADDLLEEQSDYWSMESIRTIAIPFCPSLPVTATVAQAAALLAREKMLQVPIVNDDDNVVGVVSCLDVVRWLAESAGLVARPIAENDNAA